MFSQSIFLFDNLYNLSKADKITGMLLELDMIELNYYIKDTEALMKKVKEAHEVKYI